MREAHARHIIAELIDNAIWRQNVYTPYSSGNWDTSRLRIHGTLGSSTVNDYTRSTANTKPVCRVLNTQ